MMTIRPEQFKAFDAAAERDLRMRLMMFLREEMPEHTATLDDDQLSAHIMKAAQCAERHGIESDLGVAQYACLSLATGPFLADNPLIAAVLKAPGTEPEEQLHALIEFIDSQLYVDDD
ncbi:hypothetical protein D7V97_24510 [Corallococcus sp. CA053C]|uniref:hypothetical protein n=1 Tax=Corallococcus sp. CA053C TaxID=2316732 RepID=UPI000EA2B143|nr:hypothetical protein [Corallococcus sp. CA053C]RKH05108.1 hypothetical protein D7V97_24510 [Corallococcus sp. CA053C]